MSTRQFTIEVDVDSVAFKSEYTESIDPAYELGSLAVMLLNSELTGQLGGKQGLTRAGILSPIRLVRHSNG
jgi:hypothetical protein